MRDNKRPKDANDQQQDFNNIGHRASSIGFSRPKHARVKGQ
jgi:hypothetical protein